jgi:alpha-tubulin suppressor-like RCC1 family protein
MKSKRLFIIAALSWFGCADQAPPTRYVQVELQATQVALDWFHGCALRPERDVVCWGSNEFGQLGPTLPSESGQARIVPALKDVVEISTRASRVCAVTSRGELWCWGGDEPADPSFVQAGATSGAPHRILLDRAARHVAVGWSHTCAILDDGSVQCWGSNRMGESAPGGEACADDTCCVTAPTRVIEAEASAIVAGPEYSCAVVRGLVQCWGNDTYTLVPGRDLTGCPDACATRCLSEPTLLPTAEQVSRFSGSRRLLCGAGPHGVYCWGPDSTAGSLVRASHIPDVSSDEQPIPDWINLPALDVAVTDLQIVCVLRADREVVCWDGSYDLREVARERPQPLEGASDVVQMAAGMNRVCAVQRDHTLLCWGIGDRPSDGKSYSISLWLPMD